MFFSLEQLPLLLAAFWSYNLCFACILGLESSRISHLSAHLAWLLALSAHLAFGFWLLALLVFFNFLAFGFWLCSGFLALGFWPLASGFARFF